MLCVTVFSVTIHRASTKCQHCSGNWGNNSKQKRQNPQPYGAHILPREARTAHIRPLLGSLLRSQEICWLPLWVLKITRVWVRNASFSTLYPLPDATHPPLQIYSIPLHLCCTLAGWLAWTALTEFPRPRLPIGFMQKGQQVGCRKERSWGTDSPGSSLWAIYLWAEFSSCRRSSRSAQPPTLYPG